MPTAIRIHSIPTLLSCCTTPRAIVNTTDRPHSTHTMPAALDQVSMASGVSASGSRAFAMLWLLWRRKLCGQGRFRSWRGQRRRTATTTARRSIAAATAAGAGCSNTTFVRSSSMRTAGEATASTLSKRRRRTQGGRGRGADNIGGEKTGSCCVNDVSEVSPTRAPHGTRSERWCIIALQPW